MKITLLVEVKTEKAFLPYLRKFLDGRFPETKPRLDVDPYDGPIPTGDKLRRQVQILLNGRFPSDHAIALTDVYTGSKPPEFANSADAKLKMREWVGSEPRRGCQMVLNLLLLPAFRDPLKIRIGGSRILPAF